MGNAQVGVRSELTLLDHVRTHAAEVAGSARYVRVDETRIGEYAAALPVEQARAPQLDPATHFLGDSDATLAYVVTLDAINFGSGYFPHLRKRPGLSGYFTVASSLKDVFETQGGLPLSTTQLQALTAEDCAYIFGQVGADADAQELMGLFGRALNELGGFVEGRFGGNFRALVGAADGSAEGLVELLAEMAFFRDVGFYKRAQLTAADLSIAGVAEFGDLRRLTIFADNLVPHVLRLDGVLEYDVGLLQRVEREELIPTGSQEEVEIRACAVHAVELLADALGRQVCPMQLDYVLWNRGQGPAYKARPRHRTRTVYY
jgi:Potential Queuosine, Q, salvage protein family